MPSNHYVAKQISAKAFVALDHSKLSNMTNLNPDLMNDLEKVDPGSQFALPNLWGTNGYGYSEGRIQKGEIFALLGGSGSGKPTLLRMLAGFEAPDTGTIVLDSQDVTSLPPFLRPTNMMFQSYALFPHMTVEQNIAMGLKQDKLPKSEIRDRVAAMLKLVKMEPYARRKPQQLSGGQQQRVALARSLAKRPKLLLLDEPMGALDKKLRTEMQLELVEILENVERRGERPTWGDRVFVSWRASSPILLWH